MSQVAPSELVVKPKELVVNPSAAELKAMVGEMPSAQMTAFGNYNVGTKVLARSKASTYVITDRPEEHSDQTLSRAQGDAIAKLQDDYIRGQSMVIVEGFIGPDPATRVAARLMMERRFANIAAMQQQLYFTPSGPEFQNFTPQLQILYTPGLQAPEAYPNRRVIAVDLQQNITRVLNSDYFGESKKGGLRMWNKWVYDRGGLAMHAGCKVIPVDGKMKTALIIGLSGTGKTTTTFTRQNASRPIQDDFIGLLPDGTVVSTESGCFAKTYGLDPDSEPMIHHAVTQPAAYLENVSQNGAGVVDFFDETYTQNGRATFGFDLVPDIGDLRRIPPVDIILILNRNENIIPAVARLDATQAAAYFMLGETKGTAAGGAEEAGRALRVPGTNPFFPLLHAQQGERFLQLMQKLGHVDVFLMNTGWVGGPDGHEHSKKVKIRHSSAVVKALAEGTIAWARDDDFGYEVAAEVPGLGPDDADLLRPKGYYARVGRKDAYAELVRTLRRDRLAHLQKFPGLPSSIVGAVG